MESWSELRFHTFVDLKPANLLQASMTKCKNLRILFCDANSQVRMNYLLFLISVSLVQ
ncbi:uncharacterized protein LOC143240247 isoform X6 [Tachypleus tridentatus]|uniref:uncharacterized protein LOC143240247 isoform X6 n=1 Tax=Tachypleus tridentatus TaxID=6853 RepID=UPI003FCF6BCA